MRGRGVPIALLLSALPACTSGDERPNVVLVVVDTLRVDHTTLGGHERNTTPRLAAFATERGFVFDNARSTASWTKPSMASIFTGLDPRAHGVTKHIDPLHSGHLTLAEVFREAGYATLAVQSNLYLAGVSGMGQGFDVYEDETTDDDPDGATVGVHSQSTGQRVNAVTLDWLDSLEGDRPFFLYVHHYEPHHMYLRDELVPPGAYGLDPERLAQLEVADMSSLLGALDQIDDDVLAYLESRYDSEIVYQDQLLGELLDGLAERALLGGAVVAITADHGEEFLDHGSLSHGNDRLFDELLRVPLVISGPGIRPRRNGTPVSLLQLGRTLLDLCSVDAAFPGDSLVPILEGRPLLLPVVAHGTVPSPDGGSPTEYDAVIRGKWKVVRDLVGGGVRLFDLSRDPREQNDVAAEHGSALQEYVEFAREFAENEGAPRELGPELPEIVRRQREWKEQKQSFFRQHMDGTGYLDSGEDD